MKINFIVFVAIIAILGGCSSSKNITQTIQDGGTAYQTGDYEKALAEYEAVIEHYQNEGKANECPVYTEAAAAAMQTGNTEKAIQYLKQETYTVHSTAKTHYDLAGLYRKIDNLSKELDELETYVADYPEGENIEQVNERLFEIYVETDNWEKAIESWQVLTPEVQNRQSLIEGFFITNKALKNEEACDSIARGLLKMDSENTLALDWLAKRIFWRAENLYQAELEAYDKNKTNKQYKKLLNSLDDVSADFKTSLAYFKTLYGIEPSPKTAKYLGNIYNRLDDKKKAGYYYKLAEEE